MLRHALVEVLQRQPDLEATGHAADAPTARQAIAGTRPDLVLILLPLQHASGLDLIKDLRAGDAELRILVISADDDHHFALRALKAGAGGLFMIKQDPMSNFIPAMRRVLAGKRYITPPFDEILLANLLDGHRADSPWERFSDREAQIVKLIARGEASCDIAAALRISESTVRTLLQRIKQKLGITTDRKLVAACSLLVVSTQS